MKHFNQVHFIGASIMTFVAFDSVRDTSCMLDSKTVFKRLDATRI